MLYIWKDGPSMTLFMLAAFFALFVSLLLTDISGVRVQTYSGRSSDGLPATGILQFTLSAPKGMPGALLRRLGLPPGLIIDCT